MRNMGVTTVEDYRSGPPVTRFREGAVVRPQELFAKMMRSVASTFKTTGDVAGALRHAPANSTTFTDVTTLAHMPVTHNTLYKDTYGKSGQQYESSEEDSGISDCSDDSASDGRVSPETSGELPTKRLPGRMPTRRPSVEGPAGRKQLKRKAKPKISPADTGGRDADPMPADTPADLPAPSGLSAKSADTPVACPPQADESAMSADTPTDLPAPSGLSAKSADTPIECLPQADESRVQYVYFIIHKRIRVFFTFFFSTTILHIRIIHKEYIYF